MNACWSVGDVVVTCVVEIETLVPASYLVTGLTPEVVDEHRPWADPFFDGDGNLRLSMHTFVVRADGLTVVVDTCAGCHAGRPLEGDPDFLDRLDTKIDGGLSAVDLVVCTHLHFDHVGWNTRQADDGRRVPAFPNARYLITADEMSGFADRDIHDVADTSLQPLIEADVVDRVAGDHELSPSIRLVSTPGHSPGHVSVSIRSLGESALITGDATHSPIQFARPELAATRFDDDSERSTATRRRLVSELAGTDTLVLGTHFAPPHAGHLRRTSVGGVWFDALPTTGR